MERLIIAKKGNGLKDLLDGLALQPLEEQKILSQASSLHAVLSLYREELRRPYTQSSKYVTPGETHEKEQRLAKRKGSSILLSPAQIDAFLQSTIADEQEQHYWRTAPFLEGLLQRSYQEGNNNFTLNMNVLTMRDFYGRSCRRFTEIRQLKGNPQHPLHVSIAGDMDLFGSHSEYLHCTITGKVQFIIGFGQSVKHSSFIIHGDVKGNDFANRAQNSDFYVDGEFDGEWIGGNCYVNGKLDGDLIGTVDHYASSCRFKTSNLRTLEKFVASVPRGNQIIFVNSDGREEIVRDYG